MTQKFRHPPINELVIGTYFDRDLHALRAEHVGLFWSTIRESFPTIRQQPNVVPPAVGPVQPVTIEFSVEGEMFPLPRFWIEAHNGETLMQIQRNAFLFNWRKRDQGYPHYETVKNSFDRNFSLFAQFLEKELGLGTPRIQIADLTYINLIQECEYWNGPRDTKNIIPLFNLPVDDQGTISPIEFNVTAVQRFSTDLSVWTSIRSGRSPQKPSISSLVICVSATFKAAAERWLQRGSILKFRP